MANILAWCTFSLVFMIIQGQDVPEASLDEGNCPVGKTIVIGTQATCRCVLTYRGTPPTQAHWYTKDNTNVGVDDPVDGSSVLTFSYNQSEPNNSYECRIATALTTEVVAVTYTPQFRASYRIVEKGSLTYIESPVPKTVGSITWQLLTGNNTINITTCSLATNTCTDLNTLSGYRGYLEEGDDGTKIAFLNFTSRTNETKFSYLADNGIASGINELEVYLWPNDIFCTSKETNAYVDYKCRASAYPKVKASFYRKEEPLNPSDFDLNNSSCATYFIGVNRYSSVVCTWRVKMNSMLMNSTFYAEMSAVVSNYSLVDRNVSISNEIVTSIVIPEAVVPNNTCPVAPAVIIIGTTPTCKCVIDGRDKWFSPGVARWYTEDNRRVGRENLTDMSSTLTLSFNVSDPKPKYYCVPITDFYTAFVATPYEPIFKSTAPSNALTRLQTQIIVLGAVCSAVVARLAPT